MAAVSSYSKGRNVVGQVQMIGGKAIGAVRQGSVAINPASINANTIGTVDLAIVGAVAGDIVIVEPPVLTAGLAYVGHIVTTDKITITLLNYTGSAVDGASQTWKYTWIKVRA